MTQSVVSIRVSKINGISPPSPKTVRALRVYVRPGNRHFSKSVCSGEQTLECAKIFKIFFNAIGKQSIIIKLIEQEPKVVEIASLSIPLSWIPREYYVAESFPLRPLIPGIASPIAFVEIQLSSNENNAPFTLPPADLIHIPAWRPYPKVALPERPPSSPNNPVNQPQRNDDLLIDFDSNPNQNANPPQFSNDYTPQTSINIKLKRKRSSSLCVENLEKLITENTPPGSEDEYSEESTSADPAAEYKLYMAFAPPIMRNGMEPVRLEPKKYSDAELTDILSKHAYSGALLNGQYINPPRFLTKNTPLCEKVKTEKNNGNANVSANANKNSNKNKSKNIPAQTTDASEHHHHHRRRHYHYHDDDNNNNNNQRQRSNSRSQKFPNQTNDSNKIDQRSNSIQLGGKGFFQRGKIQRLMSMKSSIRATPPPAYQELQNDVLFKDNI